MEIIIVQPIKGTILVHTVHVNYHCNKSHCGTAHNNECSYQYTAIHITCVITIVIYVRNRSTIVQLYQTIMIAFIA